MAIRATPRLRWRQLPTVSASSWSGRSSASRARAWTYCGGATALLGRLIARGTGEPLLAYCRRVLFDPMGFGPVAWAQGRDGEYRAASGLRLLPRDLLKIGQLVHAGGVWNGDQIVPRDWVKRAITPAVAIEDGRRYGYHWYLGAHAAAASQRREPWVGGIGWGGQRLYVFPRSTSSSRSTAATTTSPARNRGASTMSSSARSCCQASSRFRVRLAPDAYRATARALRRHHRGPCAGVLRGYGARRWLLKTGAGGFWFSISQKKSVNWSSCLSLRDKDAV